MVAVGWRVACCSEYWMPVVVRTIWSVATLLLRGRSCRMSPENWERVVVNQQKQFLARGVKLGRFSNIDPGQAPPFHRPINFWFSELTLYNLQQSFLFCFCLYFLLLFDFFVKCRCSLFVLCTALLDCFYLFTILLSSRILSETIEMNFSYTRLIALAWPLVSIGDSFKNGPANRYSSCSSWQLLRVMRILKFDICLYPSQQLSAYSQLSFPS